jgi:amidohydrolase
MQDDAILALRHALHRSAERSHGERGTADLIETFLRETGPTELLTKVGGHGLLAVFRGAGAGPAVLLRCELDALPIGESLAIAHRSNTAGISHKCGHDGHMAILCGVAREISEAGLRQGQVALLFQPAEETGEGAALTLEDSRISDLHLDWVFALHNLPGFPLGELLLREGAFASGSRGVAIHLSGATAHAAEPDKGRSPALAVAELIESLSSGFQSRSSPHGPGQVTVIHARVGEIAFGTSPGEGVVMVTLRAPAEEVLDDLEAHCRRQGREIAQAHGLNVTFEIHEPFPVTSNDSRALELVRSAGSAAGLSMRSLHRPFAWSEDFGHFTHRFPGALIGLGAGVDQPALHHPSYDFPDELLGIGIGFLGQLIRQACGTEGPHEHSG